MYNTHAERAKKKTLDEKFPIGVCRKKKKKKFIRYARFSEIRERARIIIAELADT